jgi:hypothetical protein
VFVTFEDGITVYEEVTVAKDHCTHRVDREGGIHMPVAIYLSGERRRGTGGVQGMDPRDILPPEGWPPDHAP